MPSFSLVGGQELYGWPPNSATIAHATQFDQCVAAESLRQWVMSFLLANHHVAAIL
jgi:hypothetical protein